MIPSWTLGCFPQVALERSSVLKVDVKDFQPLVILPIPDAPKHPHSGARLQSMIYDILTAKGYDVIPPEQAGAVLRDLGQPSTAALLSNASLLVRFKNELMVKLLLWGGYLQYERPKSYFGSGTFQVSEGASYDYVTLPTYHYGTFRARLQLKLLDPENETVLWVSEGRATGSDRTADSVTRKLVHRLLEQLPALKSPPKAP